MFKKGIAMKKSNIIMAICIVAVCVMGWFTVGIQLMKQRSLYSNYIKEADEWVDRGLYQRAIDNYNLVLEKKKSEKIYLKINDAYDLWYREDPEEMIDEYMDFLEIAVDAYPGNQSLVDSFVDVFSIKSKYEEIYNCLINAIDNGYDSEKVKTNLRKAQYAYRKRGGEFSGLKQSVGTYYSASRNDNWNIYSCEDGYIFEKTYAYVSRVNKDGILVVTGEKSRIIDVKGMVYGIFKGKVTDASLFSEGLIAACIDGSYSYYDDLADKQFGEYAMASSFQNGRAAVKKDGKWMLIDSKGKVVSETFDEIVLDYVGNYLNDGLILAKKNGVYGLYDEELDLKCKLKCSNVDILTEEGVIAVEQDGKWGFVNCDGKTCIKPLYEEARSFSNGLAAVKRAGKWGFIDGDGNVVIGFQFSDVGYFTSDGICPVRMDMPEEKVDSENMDEPEIIESMETWKMLELEIGIKEN